MELVNEKTLRVELGPILAAVRNELGVELLLSFFMENDAVGAARKALAEIWVRKATKNNREATSIMKTLWKTSRPNRLFRGRKKIVLSRRSMSKSMMKTSSTFQV